MKTITNAELRAAIESMTNRQCFDCCSNWGSLLSIDCGEMKVLEIFYSKVRKEHRVSFEGDIAFWITMATWRVFHGDQVILDSDATDMEETRRIVGESLVSIKFKTSTGGMLIRFTNNYYLELYAWPGDKNYSIKVFGTWYRLTKVGEQFVLAESP